jgi:hypothetical protein
MIQQSHLTAWQVHAPSVLEAQTSAVPDTSRLDVPGVDSKLNISRPAVSTQRLSLTAKMM